jgi:ketosteroid isomerase-like protein
MDTAMERIRAGYEAFNRGDFDESAKFVHPDVDWHRVAGVESGLRGRDAVRRNMEPVVFQEQRVEITGMEAIGDYVIVSTTFHAIGAGSGIELNEDGFHLWRMKDGLGSEFRYYRTREEAVGAARESTG